MTNKVQLYGIKNCDTVRKSMLWLAKNNIEAVFYDLKKDPLEAALIEQWLEHVEQEKLINKRGLTWRKLSDEDKILNDRNSVITLIQNNPTLVKRPVLFNGSHWTVGFNPDDWNKLFL